MSSAVTAETPFDPPIGPVEPDPELWSPAPLPRFLSPLVGREREVAILRPLLLQPEAPLVTLIGPGGVGKTRLAVRVAEAAAAEFPGGVAFVPLVAIRDAALVLPTIATMLGVREAGDRPLIDRLTAFLRDRALLVLDNLEQLPEAGPLVAELLGASPGLTVLATSRAPLRVSGERTYDVSPLSLPGWSEETGVPPDLDTLVQADAVRLFVDRARATRSDFALTETNAAAVAEVCRRLDGLPLAIELAAARVSVLPPAALLARLRQRLPLLTGGARDLPKRLQTMRDAIGWSYDLLDEEEQHLFRQLAVFAGGFTLEASEAVVGSAGDPATGPLLDPLEGIASLVDKSLLRWQEGAEGEPRYLLLETIREFGREQMVASGEEASARQRHAAWCVALATEAEPQLLGPRQRQWSERLEAEHANLRAAHAWLTETNDAASALRLAGVLWVFWFIRGHLREGYDWLMQALAIPAEAPPADRVQALWGAGMLAWAQGNFERAEQLGLQARGLAAEHDLQFGLASSLYLLFIATEFQGRRPEAIAYGEESVARMREAGARAWLAYLLADIGSRVAEEGDPARGEAWIAEGLALHREFGNNQGLGNKLSDLGQGFHEAGDSAAAARHYAEGLHHLWAGGDAWYLASPIEGLAAIAVEAGQAGQAAQLLGAAAVLRERSGGAEWPDERERLDRAIAAAQAALGQDVYAREIAAGRSLPLADVVATAVAMGETLATRGATPVSPSPASPFGLSPRELEVLRLLAAGKSNPEIAEALFIGRGTIKTHVSNILAKLGATSRTEASAIAHRDGLV